MTSSTPAVTSTASPPTARARGSRHSGGQSVRTVLSHGLVGRVRNYLGGLVRSVIRVVHGEAAVVHAKGAVVHAKGAVVHAKGAVVHAKGAVVHAKGAVVHARG